MAIHHSGCFLPLSCKPYLDPKDHQMFGVRAKRRSNNDDSCEVRDKLSATSAPHNPFRIDKPSSFEMNVMILLCSRLNYNELT
jgi:hypothetical protein